MEKPLPAIPAKRYFTIGEVSELCAVKPYVLRYWEQEFTQLKPMKRRGNRRYYQHHEVLLIRRIRELLYDQGFTISGARNRLQDLPVPARLGPLDGGGADDDGEFSGESGDRDPDAAPDTSMELAALGSPLAPAQASPSPSSGAATRPVDLRALKAELLSIRELLAL